MKNVQDIYPLTPLQHGMLLHSLERPDEGLYLERFSALLEGPFDEPAFRRAWETVLTRHAVLRTAFLWQGLDEPLQVVRETVRLPWRQEDWRHLSPKEQDARLRAYEAEDAQQGFPPHRAPLMRLALFRLGDTTRRLAWSHHHLLLDGWARAIVLQEVFALYEAERAGRALELPPRRPFRDYVAWLKGQDLSETEAYWRRELDGFTTPTPLPGRRASGGVDTADAGAATDSPVTDVPNVDVPSMDVLNDRLSEEETQALRQVLGRSRLTLNTLAMGAFSVLLARHSGEGEVVFGVVVAGRPPEVDGIDTMIGPLINTLPARLRVPSRVPAAVWLRDLQARQVNQRQHESSPLVRVHGWSDVPRDQPLFESLLVFENHPTGDSLRSGGRSASEAGLALDAVDYQARAHYPLGMVVVPQGALEWQWHFDRRRIREGIVRRLSRQWKAFIRHFLERPTAPLAELACLDAEEARQVLIDGNDTWRDFPQEATLPSLFREQVARRGEAVAVRCGGRALTYRQLDEQSDALAGRLLQLGVGLEERVAILAERSERLIVAHLAVVKAGAAYLPLDGRFPDPRLALLLEKGEAVARLTESHFAPRFETFDGPSLHLDDPATLTSEPPIADLNARGRAISPHNLAFTIFTSGSTGKPKGVAVPHRQVIRLAVNTDYLPGAGPEMVFAFSSTPAFDGATTEIWTPLLNGGCLAVLTETELLDPDVLEEALPRLRVDTLFLTTALFHLMAIEKPALLGRLRTVLFGGESSDPSKVRALLEAGGPERLLHLYGPTETTTCASWKKVESVPDDARTVPIGGPLSTARLYVLGAGLSPTPTGGVGELFVGGEGVTRGYLGEPGRTAQRFLPDPHGAPGGRMYRTGDRVRLLEPGEIEFLGRFDHQIKMRGFRIELGEIENVLRRHPQVGQAVVRAMTAANGRTVLRLAAYVTPRDAATDGEAALNDATLREFLEQDLPSYMVPSVFAVLPSLPLNAQGKIDWRRLPQAATPSEEPKAEAPRTAIEQALIEIWSDVLGLGPDQPPGVDQAFLDLGGHSLIATRLASRLRQAFGVEIPLSQLLDNPTIAELAPRLAIALQASGPPRPPLTAVSRERALPLSFAQERLWFLDRLGPGSPAYNIPLAMDVRGQLDVPRLRRALAGVFARHESLRTRFVEHDGTPVQDVMPVPSADGLMPMADLTALSAEDERTNAQTDALTRREARRPFVLSRDLMLRAVLVACGEDRHRLLLTLHHIAADGWSAAVLLRDLTSLYRADAATAHDATLPLLPVQVPDFAVWQRTWLDANALDALSAAWRERLAGAPERLDLPTDRPRPAVQTVRGAVLPLAIDPATGTAFSALARAEGSTLFMALLAGFATLLARYSGQADLVIGTPIAGRNRLELEGLIGFFVNMLPLRLGPAPKTPWTTLLRQAREVTLDAYAHQDLPFEKLVEALQPTRDLSISPFFQVQLVLQNLPRHTVELPNLRFESTPTASQTAKYDLTLALSPEADSWVGSIEYNTDLFDAATIERFGAHFRHLLVAITEAPGAALQDLPLLPASEHRQLILEGEPTAKQNVSTLPELFATQVRRTPNTIALRTRSGILTYAELEANANALAGRLLQAGLEHEDLVAIFLDRDAELIIALLAVLTAGGAYVPLDPSYPRARLATTLDDAQVRWILTGKELAERLPESSARTLLLPLDGPEDAAENLASVPVIDPRQLAYLIYTSGSTGRPKGVAIAHQSAAALLAWSHRTFRDDTSRAVLASTSICFDLSIFEVFAPLTCGGTVVLVENALALAEPGDAGPGSIPESSWMPEISLINTVPSAMTELLRLGAVPTSVRTVNLAGEALPGPLVDSLYERGVERVFNLYGPSEDTTYSTWALTQAGRTPPIGQPVDGTRAALLDRRFRPVPWGSVGELFLGGEGLARGYYGQPAATAARFLPDPFAPTPGARLYRTGDRARRLSDGPLQFLGRADQQVKLRGFRVELDEIEALIQRQTGVHEAAVSLETSEETSGAEGRLVAWVVLNGPGEPSDLAAALREHLPRHMVPTRWRRVDALPRTPNGKLDRRALTAGIPGAEESRPRREAPPRPPRSALERRLVAIWCDLLGLDEVGIDESFFDLGGHSLLLPKVLVAVRRETDAEIQLTDLFRYPTIATLAATLEARRRTESEPLTDTRAAIDERAARRRQAPRPQARQRAAAARRRPGAVAVLDRPEEDR